MQFRYVSLSKRPLTGKKSKLKSFVPSFIQSSRKYTNYFQSPSKDEELLLVKKKFIKLSKKGKSTSSFLSFITSINNLYLHKKKYEYNTNNKTSKNNNNLILTSMDNSSIINSKDKIRSYNSNNNSNNNISINKSRKKSKKKTPEPKYFSKNKINGCSFTTTGGNDKSKNKNKIISKTGLNSKKNSKEKEITKEKTKGKKKNNKILIKKLNEIQIINTVKPNCNSYRTSGGIGILLNNNKGRAYPFSNKNVLDSIFYRLEKPKTGKIQNNNLNAINIFDDYLKKAKDIKNNKKAKNINYNNFNYSNISNRKMQSPVNKNLSMNFNIPNLNYINNQSNNNKISKTAKVSPRGQLINFNSIIYSNNNKNRSKGKNKNSSYRSSKEVHSSSWRNVFKSNNYNNNLNKFKNNSSINNLNIINQAQNLKYISTYYKTKKIKQQKNNSENKNYISNNTNNIINTINTNSNGSEINSNINNINCMSNTYNLFHNIGGTMYNNYNINISNQINNHVSCQNECFNNNSNNNDYNNNNYKKKEYQKTTQNQQKEFYQISKKIKNNTANNSPNKNMTFKIIANPNNNGYINISIGKNISSNKNKKKKSNKKVNMKKTNKNSKEKEEKNKNDNNINNLDENKKIKNEKKLYFEKCNNSEEKVKKDKKENQKNYKLENDKNDQSQIDNNSNIHDSSYYMKLSEKLSTYIKNYYNKFKKYPDTSLSFYKYGRLIGQGAFGKVNLGLNILTGRVVAIKSFMKKNLEINGENMKKIIYETNLMKKLNHKNITKILEMFEDKKYILIIMEYINGGNLFSFVKKRRKLSEKTAKFLFRQIIEGIKHIHEHNIIHRDIKLENILIDINNNIKICDFGIGKILSSENELLYDQCGTPMYMAPEIFLSSKKKGYEGPPVDIWSSGIALYIMLSGTLPFDINKNIYIKKEKNNLTDSNSLNSDENEKNHNLQLQHIIINCEPKKIEKISKEAKNLLHGLLNKNPKKRITIEEILNHPWLNEFNDKKKYKKYNNHHLFTKAELLIMSKTYIDYRKAKNEDLIENFTISNLIKNEFTKKDKNITSKSSILAPYNTLIQQSEDSNLFSIEDNFDPFDDFNNKKIKLEKNELIGFNAKAKECNLLYELNNNGEVDNGMLINSKTNTISSSCILNNSQHSYYSRSINNNNNDDDDEDENEEFNIKDLIDNEEKLEIKKNNVYEQMKLMGYEKEYVKKCVDENILCHASVVFFLLMNYDK